MFVDAGEVDGVRYVDVVLRSGDPWEYGRTLASAILEYGNHPLVAIANLEVQG